MRDVLGDRQLVLRFLPFFFLVRRTPVLAKASQHVQVERASLRGGDPRENQRATERPNPDVDHGLPSRGRVLHAVGEGDGRVTLDQVPQVQGVDPDQTVGRVLHDRGQDVAVGKRGFQDERLLEIQANLGGRVFDSARLPLRDLPLRDDGRVVFIDFEPYRRSIEDFQAENPLRVRGHAKVGRLLGVRRGGARRPRCRASGRTQKIKLAVKPGAVLLG